MVFVEIAEKANKINPYYFHDAKTYVLSLSLSLSLSLFTKNIYLGAKIDFLLKHIFNPDSAKFMNKKIEQLIGNFSAKTFFRRTTTLVEKM